MGRPIAFIAGTNPRSAATHRRSRTGSRFWRSPVRTYPKPRRQGARRWRVWAAVALAVLAAAIALCGVARATASDGWVQRWDETAMMDRNRILLTGAPTLRAADIVVEGADCAVVTDRAQSLTETGDYAEFVIDLSPEYDEGTDLSVTATYRSIGIDPLTGERIGCVMRLADFVLTPEAHMRGIADSLGLPALQSEAYDLAEMPQLNPNAMQFDYPNIRLAENFEGGYWMLGVEKCTIDLQFFYDNDPSDIVDLTDAFVTIQSLNADNNGYAPDGSWSLEKSWGQEAVMPAPNTYEHIYLTPDSLVGRWGDLRGYSGATYPGSERSGDAGAFFYQSRPDGAESDSDRAVTLYGVTGGSNLFRFEMLDTQGWTHNMPYFGALGSVKPDAPEKHVTSRESGEPVARDAGYRLGDTVVFETTQAMPSAAEMLGSYTFVRFEDEISDDLSVKELVVLREDGSEVATGTRTGAGENQVSYAFDLAQEDVRGHTYTFRIVCEVTDYPDDGTLEIQNSARTVFGASNMPEGYGQDTNEVAIELESPELAVEKHLVIDQDATVVNSYEYLVGEVLTYEATVWNENANTRAKDLVFSDMLEAGLDYVEGSAQISGGAGDSVAIADSGNGWKATRTDFDGNEKFTVRYQARATEAANGREVPNVAEAWARNIPVDVDGNEHTPARNVSEAYVNDPHLEITKTVSESAVQNDDYQTGEEFRVGDTFTYTVTMRNTEPGTFAKNVVLTDEDLPAGLEPASELRVTGLSEAGFPKTVMYPLHGDDDVPGEVESRSVEWQIRDVARENGAWGWELSVNYLAFDMPVAVSWDVAATQEANGFEVMNRARAQAENQPGEEFLSTDERTGGAYTTVWVNSPEFAVGKTVRKSDQAHQVGSTVVYDIELAGLESPGTLARQTTLADAFLTEGATIREGSFVITDAPEGAADMSERVDLNRSVGDQGWSIEMAQAFGDGRGYWTSSEHWRPVFKDGEAATVEGEHSPVRAVPAHDEEGCADSSIVGHDYIKVSYEATLNDMALQNELVENEVTVQSAEGAPATDRAEVTVIGAQLAVEKDSTDRGSFLVGDTASYEIAVTNLATGTTAENLQIRDEFTTAKAGTVEIVEGSIELFDGQSEPLELAGERITYVRNESGGVFGFALDTGCDLAGGQKLTVRYLVKYLANNGGEVVANRASAWADNAPEAADTYETWPADMDQSLLHLDKGSDKQAYAGGEVARYTLHTSNSSDEVAKNVVVRDLVTLDSVGLAQIVKGSVRATDEQGNAVGIEEITYHYANGGQIRGFTVETGRDLPPEKFFDVSYEVRFDAASQQTQVHNEAWVAADNTGRATDGHDILVYPDGERGDVDGKDPDGADDPPPPHGEDDPDEPAPDADGKDDPEPTPGTAEKPDAPSLDKEASLSSASSGGAVQYTLSAAAGSEDLTGVLLIDIPADGIEIDEESVAVTIDGRIVDDAQISYGSIEGSRGKLSEALGSDAVSALADRSALIIALEALEAESAASVTYDATVDAGGTRHGESLENVAVLAAEETAPVADSACVEVEQPERNPLKVLDETGDPLMRAVGAAAPFALAAIGLCAAALVLAIRMRAGAQRSIPAGSRTPLRRRPRR